MTLKFTTRLRLTSWASRCVHVYLEDDPRREREARMWAADDIYSDLMMSLPGLPGKHEVVTGAFFKGITDSAERTGRTR